MSEQPQEWTPEGTSVLMILDEETGDRDYFHCTNERNAKVAADAHNAALADLNDLWTRASEQAETLAEYLVDAKAELAAERGRCERGLCAGAALFASQAEKSLAADRERNKTLVEALERISSLSTRDEVDLRQIADAALAKVKGGD
jgi:hypothetical protein